jgi:hypothetical protein
MMIGGDYFIERSGKYSRDVRVDGIEGRNNRRSVRGLPHGALVKIGIDAKGNYGLGVMQDDSNNLTPKPISFATVIMDESGDVSKLRTVLAGPNDKLRQPDLDELVSAGLVRGRSYFHSTNLEDPTSGMPEGYSLLPSGLLAPDLAAYIVPPGLFKNLYSESPMRASIVGSIPFIRW